MSRRDLRLRQIRHPLPYDTKLHACVSHGRATTVRFRNFIQPSEMPYNVGTNVLDTAVTYDSGDYPRLLQKTIDLSDYGRLRKEQASKRAGGGISWRASPYRQVWTRREPIPPWSSHY